VLFIIIIIIIIIVKRDFIESCSEVVMRFFRVLGWVPEVHIYTVEPLITDTLINEHLQ
jgi:hypothetical protein